jgi:hypothetical protein
MTVATNRMRVVEVVVAPEAVAQMELRFVPKHVVDSISDATLLVILVPICFILILIFVFIFIFIFTLILFYFILFYFILFYFLFYLILFLFLFLFYLHLVFVLFSLFYLFLSSIGGKPPAKRAVSPHSCILPGMLSPC